jgi:peptidyl-prolyl cis-trans isomerase SurA
MKTSIERDGMNWNNFRQDIRDQVTLSRLRDQVDNRVSISEGEIDNYLANPPPAEAGKVNLAHILIRAPEQPTPEQLSRLSARAEQALAQIKSGEDFGKVAATFSDAPDALSGGILGLRAPDRLPPLFAEALNKLKPGETSDVLRSPAGLHIIKLIERQDTKQGLPALKQTHARHILIRINEVTSEADAQRKLGSIKERLDNGVDFAELARLYSDDLSASKGGDLGWLYQGDTVPEFERAMDELNIKEVSKPVRSPFGLHLIQVLERRVDEGSKDRQRLVARMALRERKADEAYQDWLRQQRDLAYVEYRLEDK